MYPTATERRVRSTLADHIIGVRNSIRRVRRDGYVERDTRSVMWGEGYLFGLEQELVDLRAIAATLRGLRGRA